MLLLAEKGLERKTMDEEEVIGNSNGSSWWT